VIEIGFRPKVAKLVRPESVLHVRPAGWVSGVALVLLLLGRILGDYSIHDW